MFRLFLPTIIRELRSLTKVILVIYVYDVNMHGERLKKNLHCSDHFHLCSLDSETFALSLVPLYLVF